MSHLPTPNQYAILTGSIAIKFDMRVQEIQQRLSLAGRYASALYREAEARHESASILNEIVELKKMLISAPKLADLFKNQLVTPRTVIAILLDIQEIANFSEVFLNFLITVAKNKRLKILSEIFDIYAVSIDNTLNVVSVRIEMAKSSSIHALTIEQMIEKKYPTQKFKYSYFEVPELLGGFRAFINEYCLDYSLISRLNRLRYQLKEA